MAQILSNKRELYKFETTNKKHVLLYRSFLETGSWKVTGSCPFKLEFPYLTVPDMIKDKMIHHLLKVEKHV